jgi:hypothetical protein
MSSRAASRYGLRILCVPVEPALHRRLKVLAAASDRTLEATCRLAFEQFLNAIMDARQRSTLP